MMNKLLLLLVCTVATCCSAFAPPTTRMPFTAAPSSTSVNMLNEAMEVVTSNSMMLAETEAWVYPLKNVLDPSLNLLSFAMLCRVVISWYPTVNVNEVPYNIVVWPTEPLLRMIRGTVPPAFGVDITPIVYLGIFTFLHEILLGQQGLLTMKIKYGI
uniref:YggT family protein n=1 Tax=Ditylum brightwellii TaxID=49249 RepID=A0A7S4RRH7_9STRA|mmetsp:Transcript_31854/g.42341  ORF Transcript_31854/g.42341 Transcript_31854/m.42341 type:complete len:157 (+) Transcript_31854:89-559(+)